MTNPNCGMCGNLNIRGFCNLTACSFPSNKTETIQMKKQTNADHIRSMTDEELANCITDDLCDRVCHSPLSCDGNCEIQVLKWLKQEYTP